MIHGKIELLQQVFHRFKGGADFVKSEGSGVVLTETGGIVSNGLIAGPGLLQGFYFRGVKGRREFHAQELGDLVGDVVCWHNPAFTSCNIFLCYQDIYPHSDYCGMLADMQPYQCS